MKCKAIEPLIYLVREGELSAGEKAELDRHLISCKNCRDLYNSVTRMTTLIGQSDFSSEREFSAEETENIINTIEKSKIHERNTDRISGYELLIKAVAASLLLFISLTFIRQQTSFNRQRSAMQFRLEETAILAGNEDPAADCIQELERKIRISKHTPFLAGATVFNQVNEDQLTRYIDKMCGPKTGNIGRVRQMLRQAGFLTDSETN